MRRPDPFAEAQLAMGFLGAIEGGSLEASVSHMQRYVEGMTADQLRQLGQQRRRDGVHVHVARVIDEALALAIRQTLEDKEDRPNVHTVYETAREFMAIDSRAIQIAVHTARTRWGYVASTHHAFADGNGASSLPRVSDQAYRTEPLAAAAALDRLAGRLREAEDHPEERRRMMTATALGLIAERCSLLRSGLWSTLKVEPSADPSGRRKAPRRPAKAAPTKPALKQTSREARVPARKASLAAEAPTDGA